MDIFNIADIIIIIIVLLSLAFGIMKGFLREIFSFTFFILAIILASLFYSDLSNLFISNSNNNKNIKIIHSKTKTKEKNKDFENIKNKLANTPTPTLRKIFNNKKKGKTVADFIAFLSIFFFILIVGSIITYFIKKILVRGPMKSIDRILGAFFGLIRGILICSVIIYGVRKIEYKTETVNNAFIVKHLINDVIDIIKDYLPESNT